MARNRKFQVDPVCKRALENYRFATDSPAQQEQRKRSKDALDFCDPEKQWDANIRNQRQADGRPCLTVDRINPFVRQLCNDQRQNRQAIQVSPVGDGADIETAEVMQGLIRHIEQDSKGDIAYDRAYEAAVRGGFGFMRLYTDYSDTNSFEQEIKIGSIQNPFMCGIDPTAQEPDGSDAEWGYLAQDYTSEQYKEAYPKSVLADAAPNLWESIGDDAPEWVMNEKDAQVCRVIEYFERERVPVKLVKLDDGQVLDEAKLTPEIQGNAQVVDRRDSFKYMVHWYKLNAIEVLEESVFPASFVPIIPVYGDALTVDGKTVYLGLVDNMKGVQVMVNFFKSAQAEAIALAPKAPFVGPKGFRGDMEQQWATANTRNWSTLEYEPFDSQNRPLNPPIRVSAEPAIQAITEAMQGTENDLKAVTNMYDPALGKSLGDQSGTAIRQLQHQGQVGNFHFADNLRRSMRHMGNIIIEMIPKIYDTARIIRIIRPDDTHELVQVNQDLDELDPETGQPKKIDLTTGKYSVNVSTGPSFATKRQEEAAFFMNVLKMEPQLLTILGDLAFRTQDSPGAIAAADRLKKMLPPQLQEQQKGPDPQQLTQQLQQAMQHIQMLTQALQKETELADGKQAEIQAKIQVAKIQANASVAVAMTNAKSRESQAAFEAEIDHVNKLIDTGVDLTQMAHEEALAAMPPPVDPNQLDEAGEPAGAGASNGQ